MYSDPRIEKLYKQFQTWSWTRQGDGRPFLASTDTESFEKLCERAGQLGGDSALSAWDRSAAELGLKLKQPVRQPIEIDQAFRDEVQRMPSSDLLKKMRDPIFKQKFDVLAQEDATIRQPDAEDYSSFQAQNWKSLPANTLGRLMTKPAFRKRIDQLVAEGSI